jgi:hypothetical protein
MIWRAIFPPAVQYDMEGLEIFFWKFWLHVV